ncbi:MAG: hypothetical protein R3B13_35905 [Polyangiaceae bacterium]
MFNDVRDIFSESWVTSIYAINADGGKTLDLAIDDHVRHSPEWARLIAEHRARVVSEYPTLLSEPPGRSA